MISTSYTSVTANTTFNLIKLNMYNNYRVSIGGVR
jgi:hypothetical protein